MSQTNKDAMKRILLEGWAGPNVAVLDKLVAPDMLDHGALEGLPPGRDAYVQTLQFFNSVFSDWKITISHQVAEGDLVSSYFTLSSKHTGDGLGMAGTGKPVVLEMMLLDRFANGRLAEEWIVFDQASMMAQINA